MILGERQIGEFGDDPKRYVDANARKSYAETAPITKASGKKKAAPSRHARNNLADTAKQWTPSSMRGSPRAKADYQQIRAHGISHQPALRQLANRWVGIRHGSLKTGNLDDEDSAWAHIHNRAA